MPSVLRRWMKSAVYGAVPETMLVRRGSSSARRVALTFDDGPTPMTPRYLNLLDELGFKATFFLVGRLAKRHPDLVREYVRRGHQVAAHGFDHVRFSKLRLSALREQVRDANDAIGLSSSSGRTWLRPPYGDVDALVLGQLFAAGTRVVLWSLDSLDFKLRDPKEIAAEVAPDRVTPGEVVLLHEDQQWTLDAVPLIAKSLRDAGYELVTMERLLD